MKERKLNFFGTHISITNQNKQLKDIESLIKSEMPGYITYSNVHVVVTCKKDKGFMEAVNNANIASPDGMPLVKVAKNSGVDHIEKCSGPDMIVKVIEDGLAKGYKHYFYGSTPETLDKLEKNLKTKYPSIKIVGSYSPPYRELKEEEDTRIMNEINSLNPECIWIGLGAPKQELWMNSHIDKLDKGVMLGVGAAFDFHAGTLKRAPEWMCNNGLEWFYRLIKEPRRLWKRYFITNSLFIWYMLKYGVEVVELATVNEAE